MAYAEQTAAPKTVTAASALELFDPTLARLLAVIERASQCGDKIAGARPSPVDGKENIPSPQNLIAKIQERGARLNRMVERIETEITRIENGLS